MANDEENVDWDVEAMRLNVSLDILKGVDLSDKQHKAMLYKKFHAEDDVLKQISLVRYTRDLQHEAYESPSKAKKKRNSIEHGADDDSPRALKRRKCDGPATPVQIKTDVSVELCTRKIATLNEKKRETLHYFGREGTEEVFNELVMSKKELIQRNEGNYNMSLVGHPGAGKSTLVWAVAHHIVNTSNESVLWMCRLHSEDVWDAFLFEWEKTDGVAYVYELKNTPEDLKDILEHELTKNVSVLILDAPTQAKKGNARPGAKAFEWSEGGDKRRVIHVSSLGAFSLDSRILNRHCLTNKKLNPWNRKSFVRSVESNVVLRNQVTETLISDCDEDQKETMKIQLALLSAEDFVDRKFFFSGINARWFFNYSVKQIKTECRNCVKRMTDPSLMGGEAAEHTVNSVSVEVEIDEGKSVKVYTSAYMICMLSDKSVTDKFLALFPLVADRLGNGSPGEVFEFDFSAYLEHSHNLLAAEKRLMGQACERIEIELGTNISTGKVLRWQAGVLLRLPRGSNNNDVVAHPMPEDLDANQRNYYWFIPEDNSQPFLDFFFLQPLEGEKWMLHAIQNTVSPKHTTDLTGLKRIILGVLQQGFTLHKEVNVVFVIRDPHRQSDVGHDLERKCIIPNMNVGRRSSGLESTMEFEVNLLRVHYRQRGAAP